MLFKKKQISVDVMDIRTAHVSSGQIGHYIQNLYRNENFAHIGYRVENKNGLHRFVIYTLPGQKDVIQYFKDRCPAMVEEECRKLKGEGQQWATWPNGFEEIKVEEALTL